MAPHFLSCDFIRMSRGISRRIQTARPTRLAALPSNNSPFQLYHNVYHGRSNHSHAKPPPDLPFLPSEEQQNIVRLARTHNVVVSARPGSGKTATAEAIVAANPDLNIVFGTFSKSLQLETKHRLSRYINCRVYTFHGLAGAELFRDAAPVNNTAKIRQLRGACTEPALTGPPPDLIILDELQDCSEPLFWIICLFIDTVTSARGGRAPRIVVLGDERQAIYDFLDADARYLSLAPEILSSLSPDPWIHLTLSTSFRLSHETCAFINKVYLKGADHLKGSRDGPRPIYLYGAKVWEPEPLVAPLRRLIDEYGVENTAILAPSVKQNSPVSKLVNILTKSHGYPIAEPLSDDVPIDNDVTNGKIIVASYNQFKGSERDLVIVYGADDSYFTYYGKNLPDNVLPNTVYVAATRAKKQLVLVHSKEAPLMSFSLAHKIMETTDFRNLSKPAMAMPKSTANRQLTSDLQLPRKIMATDLTRHLPEGTLEKIVDDNIRIRLFPPPAGTRKLNAPGKVTTDETQCNYEAVSDINGLAVVAAFEHNRFGTLSTLEKVVPCKRPPCPQSAAWAPWLCRRVCVYITVLTGYKVRLHQMRNHNFRWLEPYLNEAVKRLRSEIPESSHLEFETLLVEHSFNIGDQSTELVGQVDIIQQQQQQQQSSSINQVATTVCANWSRLESDSGSDCGRKEMDKEANLTTIWEIKLAAELSLEHVVQVCIYAYLWTQANRRKNPVLPRIALFNIQDGVKWEITVPTGLRGLREMIEAIMMVKYTARGKMSTDKFLEQCSKTAEDVKRFGGRDGISVDS